MLREYAIAILKVASVASVAVALSHSRMKKSVSVAVGLVLISVIMLPIVDIIRNKTMFEISLDDFENLEIRDETIERAFEAGIEKYIASEWGVGEECVDVRADELDLSKMRARRIYVTLRGRGIYLDYQSIEDDVERNFTDGGECEVELDVG